MDILSDILTTLRLRGTVYFEANFGAPWGMDIKGGAVANFHLVVQGRCWYRCAGRTQSLEGGDVIVFPHGDRHTLLHAPDGDAQPAEALIGTPVVPDGNDQLPCYGGSGNTTRLICGHFEIDRAGSHALLGALPAVIHLRRDEQTDWVASASQIAVAESASTDAGANAIVDRLAEVLLIRMVRAYSRQTTTEAGFLAALRDPALASALNSMHADPQHGWQLAELARESAVSTTVLVERFQRTLGVAPMQYLTQWRMHKAREMLMSGAQSTGDIAQRVGYASEWSFSKAYKRVFGEGPGATRRTMQQNAE